jgi:hypothetical protein
MNKASWLTSISICVLSFLFAYLNKASALGGLDTTAGGAGYVEKDLLKIGGNAVNIALSFVGVLFLIVMIAGGFIWMTAAGNEDRVKTAIKLIVAGVIGLLIVVSAYAITSFVGGNFIQ